MYIKIMLKEQCVSVTELRTKTKECLEELEDRPKYIFVNNQPVAVLISIERYEQLFQPTDLLELPEREASQQLARSAREAVRIPKHQLVDL